MMSVKRKRILVVVGVLVVLLAVALPVAQAGAELACGPFGDVSGGSPFCANIIRIFNLGITQGCGLNIFCPTQNVPREQMAAFMDRLTKATTTVGSEPYIFNIDHQGVGVNPPAMIARSNDGDGIRGISYGTGIADNGVLGQTNSTDSTEAGVRGLNTAAGAGVYGSNSATGIGVRGFSATNYGVYGDGGNASGDYGGYFTGYGGIRAVGENSYGVDASASSQAGHFVSTGSDGLYASTTSTSSTWWGNWGYGNAGYGVYADTNSSLGTTYAARVADNLSVGGSCTGCRMAAIALNGSDVTLEPGDLVAITGITDPISPESKVPVIVVQRVESATDAAVFGVVEGHYSSELIAKEIGNSQTRFEEVVGEDGAVDLVPVVDFTVEEVNVELVNMVVEPAAPGEYVTILYSGMAQVKVDASAGAIQVGDSLVAGLGQGFAAKAGTRGSTDSVSFATALEPLSDGTGLIWALVNLR